MGLLSQTFKYPLTFTFLLSPLFSCFSPHPSPPFHFLYRGNHLLAAMQCSLIQSTFDFPREGSCLAYCIGMGYLGRKILFALKKQCSITAASRPRMNEHPLDAQPAKCSDLLRINSAHARGKMTLISLSFFPSSYHTLFASGERFPSPAPFSNQIST